MESNLELQHVIYHVMKTQIEFGAYQFEERLPTIEDAAKLFMVSVKTIRNAYQRLAHDGYISISKSVGVKVKVQYREQEFETNIQHFFAERKNALLDLNQSMSLLFSNAQWLGFKNASLELLTKIEQLANQKENLTPYIMVRQLQYIYGALGNDLLLRFVWHSFMFSSAPFLSVPRNLRRIQTEQNPLLEMIRMCRLENWQALRSSIIGFHNQRSLTLSQFYEERISSRSERQTNFIWTSYKKASQVCYSLGMEFLIAISTDIYPVGSLLPSAGILAQKNHVSVNTIRRTIALLNNIGATKSINGVGTQVLAPEQIAESCDLSKKAVRERLLDYAKSLHILALSCKQTAIATTSAMNQKSIENWKECLKVYSQTQRQELVPYAIINLISKDAPFMAVRTIYAELFQQLFWGYPLRNMLESSQEYKSFYLGYYDCFLDCLDRSDMLKFSAKLEELLKHELQFTVSQLTELGIDAAGALVLDQ